MPRTFDLRAWLEVLQKRGVPMDARAVLAEVPVPWQPAVRELLEGPDRSGALLRALTLPDAAFASPWATGVALLLHQGAYAARLMTADPSACQSLGATSVAPSKQALVEQIESRSAAVGLATALGEVRTREYLELALREVDGAPLEEVGARLCTLAAACTEALLRAFGIHEQVVVFGMGKLGGNELNFLSDIDLIFVHDDELEDGGAATRTRVVTLHDQLRRVVRMLEGEGRFRPLFRVDLRLRPFGSRGPLSQSMSATESYYERYGRDWERQAWIRARPIAGRMDLGAGLLERLTPFVYRRSVSPSIFNEVQSLMHRARRDARRLGSEDGLDLKLDIGGIREVEFSVQAFQLLHGGRNPQLRTASTLVGLDRLLMAGLLRAAEHHALCNAYRYLRRVEHRLQLCDGQQTHSLPVERDALLMLAARLRGERASSVRASSPEDVLSRFQAELDEHRRRVCAIAESIARPVSAPSPRIKAQQAILDFGAPPHVRKEALRFFGVRDPDEAEALLQHLVSRPNGALSAQGATRQGAERMLIACLEASSPDAALARYVEFAAHRPAHYGIWRYFADPPQGGDPARQSAEILGTSEVLSRGFVGMPPPGGALRDDSIALLQTARGHHLPSMADFVAAAEAQELDPRGPETTLLRFQHQQLVSVAMIDLQHRPGSASEEREASSASEGREASSAPEKREANSLAVGRSLSDLADLVVRLVLRDLAAETAAEHPELHGLRLGVCALGKFGMQAMDYLSDLDLLFVFEAHGAGRDERSMQNEAIRLGQRLIAKLQDRSRGFRLYEVDMRLRPSGRQGVLVSALAAFERYHDALLPVWERLALLRLRPIAEVEILPSLRPPLPESASEHGSEGVGEHMAAALPGPVCAAVQQIVNRSLHRCEADGQRCGAIARQVTELKARIERELAREGRGWINTKTGRGGCLELELLVSALQLCHGPQRPELLGTSIMDALDRMSGTVLPEAESRALAASYRFQRLFLNRLRMHHQGGVDDPDRFAQNSPRLKTLARTMGLASPEELLDQLHRARDVVRASFDRYILADTLGNAL